MADVGYFDSVNANMKAGVGAQAKGISEWAKADSEAGVSASVNALDTGVKAAAAIGGFAEGLTVAAMLPLLGAMGMKGMAYNRFHKALHKGEGAHNKVYREYVFNKLKNVRTRKGFMKKLKSIKNDLEHGKTFYSK